MMHRDALDLELDVLDWNRGQLTVVGRKVQGQPALSEGLIEQLSELESDPKAYGRCLFDALLPVGDDMRESYRTALKDARNTEKFLRFKLTLSLSAAEPLHRLRWECLFDPEKEGMAIARSPDTAFSRYAPIGRDDAVPSLDGRPCLLVAVAAPSDCEMHGMDHIDRDDMYHQLATALKPLEAQLDCEVMQGPVTLSNLRTLVFSRKYHALHLVAHSYVDPYLRTGLLALEEADGRCQLVEEEVFPQVFLGDSGLRLLTLISCQGGVQSLAEPLSGIGRRLVASGVPAVISMQNSVSFVTAEEFSKHFYGSLAQAGSVDTAVNEARQQLFLLDESSRRWSDPLLFMRLRDGAIWRYRREEQQSDQSISDTESTSQISVSVENKGSTIGKSVTAGNIENLSIS